MKPQVGPVSRPGAPASRRSQTEPAGQPFAAQWLDTALSRSWPTIKRAMDIIAAGAALFLAAPLLMGIAIAIKLDSRGPVFYRTKRMGYRGKPFMMLKFRKMYDDAAAFPLTGAADKRLTPVGGRLTRSRLDELPQLWDVLRGRMSLIGPRPEDPRFVAVRASEYDHILAVRPGITGLSQIAFADESNILDPADPVADYVNRIMPHKVHLDLLYASRNRVRLDLSVIFWTSLAVLTRRQVAVHRTDGRMNLRRRPATIRPRHGQPSRITVRIARSEATLETMEPAEAAQEA